MGDFALDNSIERKLAAGHAGLGLGVAGNDITGAPNLRSDGYAAGFERPAQVSRELQNVLGM